MTQLESKGRKAKMKERKEMGVRNRGKWSTVVVRQH